MKKLNIPLSKNALTTLLNTIALFKDRLCRDELPVTYEGCCSSNRGKINISRFFTLEVHSEKMMFLLFPKNNSTFIASGSKKSCIKIFPIASNSKVLARTISTFPIESDRHQKIFLKEATFLSLLNDFPGPKTYGVHYDYYSDGKRSFKVQNITMELYDFSLDEVISSVAAQRIELSDQQKLALTSRIVQAVLIILENDILHRDIKPDNILLNRDFKKVVLSDFGTCCEKSDFESKRQTEGTANYLSPQNFKYLFTGTYPCAVSDEIWSLACTLWCLWNEGVHPWFQITDGLISIEDLEDRKVLIKEILIAMRRYDRLPIPEKGKDNPIGRILGKMLRFKSESRSSITKIRTRFNRLNDRYKKKKPTKQLTRKFQDYSRRINSIL